MAAAILGAAIAAACSGDPDTEKRRYYDSGNSYFAQSAYSEAAIQYQNALQIDPRYAEARYRLAETYEHLGENSGALREYVRAADLMGDRADVQMKAAEYLLGAQQWTDARDRAERALRLDERNAEAHILRGTAVAGLNDLETAVKDIEAAIALDPGGERAYLSLGTLELYRNRRPEAEAAFQRALEIDPTSVRAHLALANYTWALGRRVETEGWLRSAVAVGPDDIAANRTIASFYIVIDRAAEAEPYLRRVADLSPDPSARLVLADYYISLGRPDAAGAVLRGIEATHKVMFSGARVRLAWLQYQSDPAGAQARLDEILVEDPGNPEVLTVKSRLLLDERNAEGALSQAKAAVSAQPGSAAAHYALGLAHAARGELDQAVSAFTDVLRLNPRAANAELQLARMQLMRGGTQAAVQHAESAVATEPRDPLARALLARTLMAAQNWARAESILQEVVSGFPAWAPAHAQLGTVHLAQRRFPAARLAYERALSREPGLLEAIGGLAAIDVAENRPAAARARVEAHLATTAGSVEALMLAARTYASTGDLPGSVDPLRKALEIDPSNPDAYGMLAQAYFRTGRLDEARQELERVVAADPQSVTARTMIGVILQMQGKTQEAKERYQAVLAADSRAAVAANNLAWIYATGDGSLDEALSLAQTAKAELPDRAEVDDTIGWVYYRKHLASLAIRSFRESIAKDPRNPVYHYHLGLAYASNGEAEQSRRSLTQALDLRPDFKGADEARRLLAAGPPEKSSARQPSTGGAD